MQSELQTSEILRVSTMSEKNASMPDKRIFLYLIAIIAAITVLLALYAGRSPLDIVAYLGFTSGITFIFFG